MEILVVPTDFCEGTDLLERCLPKIIDNEKDELIKFLSSIDTGIQNIRYRKREKEIDFITFHKGKDKKVYPLDLDNESEGTIKSIILYICAFAAIYNDQTMFVDELNIKLHPLLVQKLS